MKSLASVYIDLDNIKEGLKLTIDCRSANTLFDAEDSAPANNEARFQLVEGFYYDFSFNQPNFRLGNVGEQIVQPHSRFKQTGTIAPNIFVGTLSIPIIEEGSEAIQGSIDLEVQSVKSGYRDDYRDMLELITEKCTDLLLQANSPVSHHFDIDYSKDSQTLYQKFAFIKSVIGTDEFAESVHRIVTAPVTKWKEISENRDIRNARRFSNTNVKEILKSSQRTKLPEWHYLIGSGIETVPERISNIRKTDSVDTPENRFVKHALESFLKFCTDINNAAVKDSKLDKESLTLIRELESQLHHTLFKDISRPTTLKLNSPVLQRKEGYREILRVWLMFDLAAKLIWKGGDDIYSGGKKDIAILYEYWLFFKLLDLVQSMFEMESKDISDLIKETPDGLNLQIKQGKDLDFVGIYNSGSRKLNIRFSYNRSFSGEKDYPNSGSWTTTLRPDYTLTFWPIGILETEAETQELIVHIHFDAKYKIANLADFLRNNTEIGLDEEKTENRKGIYKNADLLKMHAYKDAIRRSGGAYVLYPGAEAEPVKQKGFHEIIPGLGAFSISPSKLDSGTNNLKAFIKEIINHFLNRASQRERFAFRTYDIHQNPPDIENEMRESMPEAYGLNRALIPDETFVLIGFYNSKEQYDWIKKNKLYNFRMGTAQGSLPIDMETISSKYLLLHTVGDIDSGELWQIVQSGARIFSKDDLLKNDYPTPSQDNYLVLQLEEVTDIEFKEVKWDFRRLKNYSSGRASARPYTATLTELMKCKVSR